MSDGRFSSDNQPTRRRGPGMRRALVEALRNAGKTEADVLDRAISVAFTDGHPAMSAMLARLCELIAPPPRPSLEPVEFDFDPALTPVQQIQQVQQAVASGVIPADIGAVMVGIIKDGQQVRSILELEPRILALERMLEDAGAGKAA